MINNQTDKAYEYLEDIKNLLNFQNIANVIIILSMSKWVLKWEDEFDNKAIDTNKWEIENESGQCNG